MSPWTQRGHHDGAGDMTRGRLVSTSATLDWEQALITGNGRQGALVYGDPHTLLVTLSHERLLLPVDTPLPAPGTAAILPQLREDLFAGRFQQAADEVVRFAAQENPGYERCRNIDPFIGAATLSFAFDRVADATGYQRCTDFTTGVVTQSWRTGGDQLRHDVFVSRTDDVVVARLVGPVSGRLRLGPVAGEPPVPIDTTVTAATDRLGLQARFPSTWPGSVSGYDVTCRVVSSGGSVTVDGAELVVRGAMQLLVIAEVRVYDAQEHDPGFLGAVPADFDSLLSRHVKVHSELFGRLHLDLGGCDEHFCSTEEMLSADTGPARVEWLCDAGRYAIISSCGERPPNLQGVWSGTFTPAWYGGYTLNGNLPSAVAALLPTGTPELLLPLFDLLEEFITDFRENARRLYGADGILVPTHCSAHGKLNHFNERWCQTFWTAGAAWLSRLYYDYWRYTGDIRHLRERALPFMVEAARFYAAFLVERDGRYVFAPSYSPENDPAGTGCQAAINATMDVAAVRDLLTNLLDAYATLGRHHPEQADWQRVLDRLPSYQVAEDGTLAEWIWPGLGENHAHRHSSHLFPLWYEPDPGIMADPALVAAAARTVRQRWAWWQRNGDEMGFGLVQLGLAAAALGMGETAHEIVVHLADRYWRTSLVSTHNAGDIFNVDICGGFPALVAAMLVRSARRRVDLLPALPESWPRGEVRGLRARDGITVRRLAWRPGVVEVAITAADTTRLTVGWPPGARPPTIDGAAVIEMAPDSVVLEMHPHTLATLTISWSQH